MLTIAISSIFVLFLCYSCVIYTFDSFCPCEMLCKLLQCYTIHTTTSVQAPCCLYLRSFVQLRLTKSKSYLSLHSIFNYIHTKHIYKKYSTFLCIVSVLLVCNIYIYLVCVVARQQIREQVSTFNLFFFFNNYICILNTIYPKSFGYGMVGTKQQKHQRQLQ